MSAVSSWLLSITGVIVLSVLSEFVLPEGQINKYTKVIFSFIILLVIIMPLPKIFGKEFDINKFFGDSQTQIQEDYLYQINLNKLTALNEGIDKKIEQEGLGGVVVSINANILSDKLEIYGVFVDLCDIEYRAEFGSKDIKKAKLVIGDILESYSLLENVEVKFNE